MVTRRTKRNHKNIQRENKEQRKGKPMKCKIEGCNKEAVYKTYSDEYTLEEIANVLGISIVRVRQIESSAIKKLKHPRVSLALKKYINDLHGFIGTKLSEETSLKEERDSIFKGTYIRKSARTEKGEEWKIKQYKQDTML